MKVYILQGLPASGKSEFARRLCADDPSIKRVNRDLLREMCNFSIWSKINESFIRFLRDSILLSALDRGFSVIIDDTNLVPQQVTHLKLLIEGKGVPWEMVTFDTSVEECIKRDSLRLFPVGELVIRKMYKNSQRSE